MLFRAMFLILGKRGWASPQVVTEKTDPSDGEEIYFPYSARATRSGSVMVVGKTVLNTIENLTWPL